MLRFSCPKCQTVLQAAAEQAGATVGCPKCKFQMQIPSAAPTAKVASPPTANPTPSASTAAPWYFTRDGKRFGPYTAAQLNQYAGSGQLLPTDLVWKEGMEGWKPASTVKGLFAAQQPPSKPAPLAHPSSTPGNPFESLATPNTSPLTQAKNKWQGLNPKAKAGIIAGAVAVPLVLILLICGVVGLLTWGKSSQQGGAIAQKDGSKKRVGEGGKGGTNKGEDVGSGGTKSAEYERQYKLGLQMGRTLAKGWEQSGKTDTVRQHCLKSLRDAEKTINDYMKSYPPSSDAVQGPIGYRDGMRVGLKEGGFPL